MNVLSRMYSKNCKKNVWFMARQVEEDENMGSRVFFPRIDSAQGGACVMCLGRPPFEH